MKGKYKAAIALLLLLILLPLTLLLTVAHWLPTLAGLWLPQGTRIAISSGPRVHHRTLILPELRYLTGDCVLAEVKQARLSHPSRWRLHVEALTLDSTCFSQLPASDSAGSARSLVDWQRMLPRSWVTVDTLTVKPWGDYRGALALDLTPWQQRIDFQGEHVALGARITGRQLTVDRLQAQIIKDMAPVSLTGNITLPLMPGGLPDSGRVTAHFQLPPLPAGPQGADVEVNWRDNRGQFLVFAPEISDPLLDLPWEATPAALKFSDGRWNWPYAGFPLSGRLRITIDDWRRGFERARITGRLNVLTTGRAGKGNAVLSFGPGQLSMAQSAMPLRLTGEAKQGQMIFYGSLPATLSGPLNDPQLQFEPGALLRSRGRLIDALNIDEIRWPLAGVRLTQRGVDGRLQAILRAHENALGNFTLHLDGKAHQFLPDSGLWQWRYWGDGRFTPMQARWDVKGHGEWRDNAIKLLSLSTGFDSLTYGAMTMNQPRLALTEPVIWQRDSAAPLLKGAFILNAQNTIFGEGSTLPPSQMHFSVQGRDPTWFLFKGDLQAQSIGPIRLQGRWDGERLRGEAWWPRQPLTVFQPLLPTDWKLALKDGEFYAQIAFSAAQSQGFEAGGHGVVKNGSAWLPDNQINGVDFILPFRYREGIWNLGTRGPVRLHIAEVQSQVVAKNVQASLQGSYPWRENAPLWLSDVSVDALDGRLELRQLRMPQHDAALLRVENISSSELISAINPKQFTLSGRINGALPLWLNHPKWIIKDGWLNNPGPLTLRLDKDTVDAIVRDNMAAGSAINWLRYMEISHSWTHITLDNLGLLTLRATLTGVSRVGEKEATVKLNYQHGENVFTLWRSLRFGDNLQSWLEQNMSVPTTHCQRYICKESP
ncbi:YdbH family protein [Erwinia sp. HR93]|uniref:YdbH family protein n=1 Tax=Erwinia sp. HR93 TaxID=3094840 RepID=UPI002ADEC291|nr:YdbH family protein [Erwinia sp. HR93]MEA1064964.1 YdbH family protein [Erwinia sp. HR93]